MGDISKLILDIGSEAKKSMSKKAIYTKPVEINNQGKS